jgi:hypothetical protein
MLNVWTQLSGYTFGTHQENVPLNLPLPLNSNITDLKFEIISGKLPDGLRLESNSIKGSAKEVVEPKTFKFVIRASKNNLITDRTFFITIEGSDEPEIITPPDLLPVGPNQTFFVLDRTPVEFQIQAIDFDTAAGQELRYFISSGDGTLPPGLELSNSGKITGLIDPLLSVFIKDRNGGYDSNRFDGYGFDYGIITDNGFDTFNYDVITFDYFEPLRVPKKLNRNYEFIITVSDGHTTPKKRKFRIYVVGEDFLKADNTLTKAGTNFYRADNTDVRTPIWITPANLGVIRANNYHIIKLDIVDMIAYGSVQYYLEPNLTPNDLTSPKSQLPPGMKLDIRSGEVFGIIPYQSDYIKTYQFTITATRFGRVETGSVSRTFTIQTLGEVDSNMTWLSDSDLGILDVNLISTLKIQATTSIANARIDYRLISGTLPPGLTLLNNGEIIGKINQYPNNTTLGLTTFYDVVNGQRVSNLTFDNNQTTVDKIYKFIVRATDQSIYSAIDQEFTLEIGTPDNKLYSNIYVTTYMPQTKRQYFSDFINNEGIFPKDLIYRQNDVNFGIRKDLRMLMFAGIETIDASEYISMIGLNHKRKRFRFGDIRTAQAKIPGTNDVVYEVVYIQMVDHQDFKDDKLPLNLTIDDFNKRNLDLKIKLSKANNVISTDASNYIWRSDEEELFIKDKEPYSRRPIERITIDRTDLQVSDFKSRNRYPNTYTNWRRRIKSYTTPNGEGVVYQPKYLPLWMRSFQDNRQELGFVLAMPLCYCIEGAASEIVLNIKNSEFNFKLLDYTVDRYIIDSVNGYSEDKYLVFKDKEVVL